MRESAINCPPAFSGRPPSLPSPLPRTGQGHLGLVSHLVMMMRVFYTNTSSYELIHEASMALLAALCAALIIWNVAFGSLVTFMLDCFC